MVFHSNPLKAFSLFGTGCVWSNCVLYYRVTLGYPGVKEYFPFPINVSQDTLEAEEVLLCENYQLLCVIAVIPV